MIHLTPLSMKNYFMYLTVLLEQVGIALDNSICTFNLYEDDELIGMARLLGDKTMSFYIKDFVILPEK